MFQKYSLYRPSIYCYINSIDSEVRHLIGFCRLDSLMKGLGLHIAELKQLDNIGPVADI